MNDAMTPAENDVADLLFAIANAEDQAQNAEDRERYAEASKYKAKARDLKTQLNALRGR